MRMLLRLVAVLLVLIGAFLIYAVINAFASEEGARIGVCIAYVVAALAAFWGASKLWSRPAPAATV